MAAVFNLIAPAVAASLLSASPRTSLAFRPPVPRSSAPGSRPGRIRRHRPGFPPCRSPPPPRYAAKRRQNKESEDQWYEEVDENASSEEIFWGEMERRRLLNQNGMAPDNSSGLSPIDMVGAMGTNDMDDASPSSSSAASTSIGGRERMGIAGSGSGASEQEVEASLASFSKYAVPDNFLYDDYNYDMDAGGLNNNPSLWEGEDPTLEEENAELNRQLDELDDLESRMGDGSVLGASSPFFDPLLSNEPWDRYQSPSELERKMDMISQYAKEFTLDGDDDDDAEATREEEEYVQSLSAIGITSARLENAAINPKAEAYFRRSPDQSQGYDTMWVSAIDAPCTRSLHGLFVNYGIQFADNFDDWEDGNEEDKFVSIEDISSYKARRVFEVTGLPCIASRTSFEIEPIRPEDMEKTRDGDDVSSGRRKPNQAKKSAKVVSGYKFNDVGDHVDHMVQALLPFSEPTRVTRFRSCVCYYDGDIELFEEGELDCDLYFAESARTFIPMSAAMNSMLESLVLALDLQFQKWLHSKVNDATEGGAYSAACISLRDRVLKEAKVLPNNIIDVSSFMDACVDVELMDLCGRELSERFSQQRPSKLLTIAPTGLAIAIPIAKYLQVPLVYARKQRSAVMGDTFDADYNSRTTGQDQKILVSKDHIGEEDRVLIIDDFLSSGSSQEALLRIVSDSGATPVGVGVLLEKEYDAGRVLLSGFDLQVESIVRIASIKNGSITLAEEDGYVKM